MAFKGKDGELYPSEAWYNASQQIKTEGGSVTTSGINKIINAPSASVSDTALPTEEVIPIIPNTEVGEPRDLSDAAGRQAAEDARIKAEEARQQDLSDERDRQAAIASEKEGSLLAQIESEGTVEEKRESELADLGFDATAQFADRKASTAEIGALMTDYNSAVAAKDLELSKVQDMPATMGFIGARMKQVERDANIRLAQKASNINTKIAIQEMKNGNFADAQKFAAQAVNDFVFDMNIERDQYNKFVEDNQEVISGLDADIQESIATQQELLDTQLEEAKVSANNVMELMMNNPGAGITLNDTYEEAAVKVSQVALPEDRDTAIAELGGRDVLVDRQTGEIIRDFGSSTTTDTTVTNEVTSLVEQLNAGDLTVAPDLQEAALKVKIDELSVGQQTSVYSSLRVFEDAQTLIDLLDKGVKTGPIAGRAKQVGQLANLTTDEFNMFLATANNFTANYMRSISGVAISEKERKLLQKSLPSANKQERVNRNNIESLINSLRADIENRVGINVRDYSLAIPDPFSQKASYKIVNPDTGHIKPLQLTEYQLGQMVADGFTVTE